MTTTTTTPITTIEIEQGRCEWGEPVTAEQDRALHARYESLAADALSAAFPDAAITHTVDRRVSGGGWSRYSTRIAITREGDDYTSEHDREVEHVREILGRAWEQTCESAGDIIGAKRTRNLGATRCRRSVRDVRTEEGTKMRWFHSEDSARRSFVGLLGTIRAQASGAATTTPDTALRGVVHVTEPNGASGFGLDVDVAGVGRVLYASNSEGVPHVVAERDGWKIETVSQVAVMPIAPTRCRTATHRHKAATSTTRSWTGCCAGHVGNHRTHGNVTIVETCVCGAQRRTESNAGVHASSEWMAPESE